MREIEPPECSSRRPKTAFAPDSREIKTPFSQRIPNTRATEFGSRLNTNIG